MCQSTLLIVGYGYFLDPRRLRYKKTILVSVLMIMYLHVDCRESVCWCRQLHITGDCQFLAACDNAVVLIMFLTFCYSTGCCTLDHLI